MTDARERILYFEGEPRSEMKFINRAVSDDKNLQVVTLQRTADNKFLEALVKIEDEGTFNEPMYMTKRWRKVANVWAESICAENNTDYFEHNLVPKPQAERPDF